MVEIAPHQLALFLVTMLILSVFGAMFVCWAWMLFRLATGQRLLPTQPLVSLVAPPWRGGTVLLAFVSYLVVNSVVVNAYLRAQVRVPRKARDTISAADQSKSKPEAQPSDDDRAQARGRAESAPNPGRGEIATKPDKKIARGVDENSDPIAPADSQKDKGLLSLTEQMFLVSAVNCVLLIVLPLLLRATSGARLHDLGLSLHRWQTQVAVGVIATLIAAPVVYAIQLSAIRIWKPHPHALQRMLLNEFDTFGVADLAIISAVILAPMAEELMFRGLLQRWCIDAFTRGSGLGKRKPESPAFLDDAALATSSDEVQAADSQAEPQEMDAEAKISAPSRVPVVAGITISSLLFGAVHFDQWPAPIPLFVLALIIGTVYYRTGSLIAAILMHATFNGFSTLAMFAALLVGNPKGAEKALEGWWQSRSVVVQAGREICGTTPSHAIPQIQNSKAFLLDERRSD